MIDGSFPKDTSTFELCSPASGCGSDMYHEGVPTAGNSGRRSLGTANNAKEGSIGL